MAFKKCCCCSLKTGLFIYAVLILLLAVSVLIFAILENTNKEQEDFKAGISHGNKFGDSRLKMAYGVIKILKALILLFGVIKNNSKAILAYLVIAGITVAAEAIVVILATIIEPLAAILLIYVALSVLLLTFVYSFYKELEMNYDVKSGKLHEINK